MALASKEPMQQRPMQRIWKAPLSKAIWIWLIASVFLYVGVYAWYLQGLKTDHYPGPYDDPFRLFGIISFGCVLVVASYSLRRRFMRRLPGKVQDWLWLHVWLGI